VSKLVSTVAMTAAFTAVLVSLWQDYGPLVAMKRAALAYFAFYVVGAALMLVFRTGIEDEWKLAEQRRREQEKLKRDQELQGHS